MTSLSWVDSLAIIAATMAIAFVATFFGHIGRQFWHKKGEKKWSQKKKKLE